MKIPTLLSILICATSLTAAGQQAAEENTAASIRALEHEWTEGQSRNDNRALNLIFDNGLVYVEYGRLLTKGEYLSRIKHNILPSDEIVTEAMTVRIFGSTAIAVGTYREKRLKSGKAGWQRWRFIDTWVFKKGGWVLVSAAATRVAK
jgi:hypothetical protein